MPKPTTDYFRSLERCRMEAGRAGSFELAALWKTVAESYEVLIAHDAFVAGRTVPVRSELNPSDLRDRLGK